MKTKILALAVIMAAASLVSTVSAQDRIIALFKKCETLENVDMNIIRDNKDGKLVPTIITVIIQDNEALVNEFLAAFKAEESKMISIIENKRAGKLIPTLMRFENLTFSFNLNKNGNATISQMLSENERKYVTAPRNPSSVAAPKPTPQAPQAPGEYAVME